MARLYPPNISGTIASFYSSESEGTVLTVPFSMNKTVSRSAVSGFSLRIKSSSTDAILGILTSTDWNSEETSLSVIFQIPLSVQKKLTIGKFYKIQLAYVEFLNDPNISPVIGYYSTVGVVKYTAKPQLEINGFDSLETNINITEYVGVYHNINDQTERAYQYKFTLYAQDNTILETSGWQLHNAYEDESLIESKDSYSISYALEENLIYKIQYSVITNNGLEVNSPRYLLMQTDSIKPELKASLNVTLDYDNGCVNLKLISERNEDGSEDAATGAFILTRASSENDFATWTLISTFTLMGQLPSTFLFKDYTVEQGATYRYSLQQFNDAGIYSNRMLAPDINVYFEDAFLFDGERQLKIKFNPKISSFKTVVLESKKTTLGGKYPFIFRNGAVQYKEFPISGLISYLMDNDEFFLSRKNDLKVSERWTETTDITDENIALERKFKLEVLDWLNNGKIKLFKSPGEGNYIVRLMNVSLTPNDTTSRMIHTFSCTASEVAEFIPENLVKYELLNVKPIETKQMRWGTILLDEFIESVIEKHRINKNYPATAAEINDALNEIKTTDLLKTYGCYHLKVTDCTLGTQLQLGNLNLLIGATGQYEATFDDPLRRLYLLNPTRHMAGSITYGIMSTTQNKFDTVNSISVHDITVHEVYGPKENALEDFVDVKHRISKLYYAHFFRIETQEVPNLEFLQNIKYKQQGLYNALQNNQIPPYDNSITDDMTTNDRISNTDYYDFVLTPYIIYHIKDIDQYCKYNPVFGVFQMVNNYSTKVRIGDTVIDLTEQFDIYVPDLIDVPDKIFIGSGIYAEIGMQIKEITYSVETQCQSLKETYELAFEQYQAYVLSLQVVIYESNINENKTYYVCDGGYFKRLDFYQVKDLFRRGVRIWTIKDTPYTDQQITCQYKVYISAKQDFLETVTELLKEEERELAG